MKLQIRVDEHGIISDVKFKTFGCGSAIASSSYMTERVKGLSLEDAEKIKNTEIAKELCLPPVKLHCSSAFTVSLLGQVVVADELLKQCLRRTPFALPSGITGTSEPSWAIRRSLVSLTSLRASRPAKQSLLLIRRRPCERIE